MPFKQGLTLCWKTLKTTSLYSPELLMTSNGVWFRHRLGSTALLANRHLSLIGEPC